MRRALPGHVCVLLCSADTGTYLPASAPQRTSAQRLQAIKYEPAHFEIQQQIVYCRPEQDWSGGLTVKCNAGLAVRIDAENIVETSYKPDFGPPPEGSPAADLDVQLFLNGQPITTMQNLYRPRRPPLPPSSATHLHASRTPDNFTRRPMWPWG